MPTALVLFGTRPEVIKLAPIIKALGRRSDRVRTVIVSSSQHTDLLIPHLDQFGIRIDHDLQIMQIGQSPSAVLMRCIDRLAIVIDRERPDVVVVQGDTTTALAGALAAFYAKVPVAHVEAGLRTGDLASPFPEEAHRSLIARVTRWHFAATRTNARALRDEGVPTDDIYVVGNPVVDSVKSILAGSKPSAAVDLLVKATRGQRRLLLTTHRRENFGEIMGSHLETIRAFVDRHPDIAVVFPVHPNPTVRAAVARHLPPGSRIHLIEPLGYSDFIHLASRSWLLVSDSGGIQEEAPTIGKPLIVLRDTTERPEAVECGVARLSGHDPRQLAAMLEEAYDNTEWIRVAGSASNPFGDGRAGERIGSVVVRHLEGRPVRSQRRPVSVNGERPSTEADLRPAGFGPASADPRGAAPALAGGGSAGAWAAATSTAATGVPSARPRVTVVLPAFNEERDLPGLLPRIGAALSPTLDYRVLVVDDGSTDSTVDVVTELARTMPITLIRHQVNQGLGGAIRTGLKAAAELGGHIVTLDADNSQGPELIPAMLAKIDEGADVVIASRFQPGAAEIGVPRFRVLLSHGASMTFRALMGYPGVRDYSCGFRAYRLESLRELIDTYGDNFLRERGFSCMLELLINFRRLDATVDEVPLRLRYDLKEGASKMRIWRTVSRYFIVFGRAQMALAHKEESTEARDLRQASLSGVPAGVGRPGPGGIATLAGPYVA